MLTAHGHEFSAPEKFAPEERVLKPKIRDHSLTHSLAYCAWITDITYQNVTNSESLKTARILSSFDTPYKASFLFIVPSSFKQKAFIAFYEISIYF